MDTSKTVLITGSTGGLGTALVDVFSAGEYNLILHSRKPIIDVPEDANVLGNPTGDLRMLGNSTIDAIMASVRKHGMDIFINNAAVHISRSMAEITDCEMRETIETNLLYPMILTRKVYNYFLDQEKPGMIININSIAGKEGGKFESAYCASKFGLAGFSKALQFEATGDNIRIIDVYVAAMQTKMTKDRPNYDKLISPFEVAQVIESLCVDPDSLRINEITITRRNY